jgi:hypothetical protein
MKTIFLMAIIMFYLKANGQSSAKKDLDQWEKAVVNIETEGYFYPKYFVDSTCKSKIDSGYAKIRVDSLEQFLFSIHQTKTGTAIYVSYKGGDYLITARHVLFDPVIVSQKDYENKHEINTWDTLEAIFPRTSIRTPFEYYWSQHQLNELGVVYDNFSRGQRPYFFISDSTGDGIGILSLNEKYWNMLDTLLKKNGYVPIPIESAIFDKELQLFDDVYSIGFPEGVSIVLRGNLPPNVIPVQLPDIVTPVTVKGRISMYNPNIQHFYVDLTVYPGDSGSPVIKDGKLIGFISGLNKTAIRDENDNLQKLYNVGHLVNVVNPRQLLKSLGIFRAHETNAAN